MHQHLEHFRSLAQGITPWSSKTKQLIVTLLAVHRMERRHVHGLVARETAKEKVGGMSNAYSAAGAYLFKLSTT
jgi:hypothetical protein